MTEDYFKILIVLIMLIIAIVGLYLNIKTSMDLANHYGLTGLKYWYYVLTFG